MANQTLPLNVSDEMKSDDERQNCVGMESDEGLCSSSSDTTEELYSSSTTDTCGNGLLAVEETLSLCGLENFFEENEPVFLGLKYVEFGLKGGKRDEHRFY